MTERRKARSAAAFGMAASLSIASHGIVQGVDNYQAAKEARSVKSSYQNLRIDLALTSTAIAPVRVGRVGPTENITSISAPDKEQALARVNWIETDLEELDLDRTQQLQDLRNQIADLSTLESTQPALSTVSKLLEEATEHKNMVSKRHRNKALSFSLNLLQSAASGLLSFGFLQVWRRNQIPDDMNPRKAKRTVDDEYKELTRSLYESNGQ